MRNLCVILADQLNQEISSLNDFDKNIDEVLICEFEKNFIDINHHKKKIVYQISSMRHFGKELDAQGFKTNYLKLDDPKNQKIVIHQKFQSSFKRKTLIASLLLSHRLIQR